MVGGIVRGAEGLPVSRAPGGGDGCLNSGPGLVAATGKTGPLRDDTGGAEGKPSLLRSSHWEAF